MTTYRIEVDYWNADPDDSPQIFPSLSSGQAVQAMGAFTRDLTTDDLHGVRKVMVKVEE